LRQSHDHHPQKAHEVALPFEAIDAASAPEKSIRRPEKPCYEVESREPDGRLRFIEVKGCQLRDALVLE
jgi:hypothetical protein